MSFPLYYVICVICISFKETKISQKRSKGIKSWKKDYSVILSVLSNKTNLILGFSSPLSRQKLFYFLFNLAVLKLYLLILLQGRIFTTCMRRIVVECKICEISQIQFNVDYFFLIIYLQTQISLLVLIVFFLQL